MFYPLPAETVFEIRNRTRRDTFYLFLLLCGLYVFFVDLLVLVLFFPIQGGGFPRATAILDPWLAFASLGAALLAALHFLSVRRKTLEDMLARIGAVPADGQDLYHKPFIDLVSEAEAATGISGIRPVVLSTPGCNAFSLQDGRGRCAIGATEGLLAKLTRSELSAVVAHEAAHLLHEDSRLVSTAWFLFQVFGGINAFLAGTGKASLYAPVERRSSSRGPGSSVLILALWLVSGVGYGVTKLISMAISREREYLADADGVSMCKDPLALAEGLYKISHRYRGYLPEGFAALFILNPSESGLDEKEGLLPDLFSNHPPVSKRLSRLLAWARTDLETLGKIEAAEEAKSGETPSAPAVAPGTFMAYQDGRWVGPYTPEQLLVTGLLAPSSWVCPKGGSRVARASDTAELVPLLSQQVKGVLSAHSCPRCKVPLVRTVFEGAEVEQCTFCRGHLLRPGILERMAAREEGNFTPEDVRKAKAWRDVQRGPLKDRDAFPEIHCPACGGGMGKSIHSYLTQVVVDHCFSPSCGAVWCDGGELETIQMIIQDARAGRPIPV
jgi:heat shock protein HtpX